MIFRFFNHIFPKALVPVDWEFAMLKFSVFLFLVTGAAAIGNRIYLDWAYQVDEYGMPIGCQCSHCKDDILRGPQYRKVRD
jgi:hypothetical protein